MQETIVMPKLGMTMKEGTIAQWYKEIGEPVEKGEAILMISSDKLNQDIEAPIDGVLLAKNGEVDEELEVGAVIGVIGKEGSVVVEVEKIAATHAVNSAKSELEIQRSTAEKANKNVNARIFITPLARRMAAEKKLAIQSIEGTGGNGRITKRDVLRAVAELPKKEVAVTAEVLPGRTAVGEGLSPMRKAIAQNMRNSLEQSAQLTLHRKIAADPLMDFQKVLAKEIESSTLDVKLTATVLLAKATVLALQSLKKLNSTYAEGQLKEFDEVHLGVATSLENGLVVPVIRNAHQLTISQLAKEIKALTEAARNGTIDPQLLSGSTFTITNLGATGIEYFTPILNAPETGILGVGAYQDELILAEDGSVKVAKKIPLSLTFDHQIADGVDAAQFLSILSDYIESPYRLVL